MGREPEAPKDLVDRLIRLEKRLAILERSPRLVATSLDAGSLTVVNGFVVVRHPNGTELLRTGVSEDPTLGAGHGTRISRASGTKVLDVFSASDGVEGTVVLYDKAQHPILMDDTDRGGLTRPFLPYRAITTASYTAPTQSTVNGSYESLWTIAGEMQHMGIQIRVRVVSGGDTTGNMQIWDPATSADLGVTAIGLATNDTLEAYATFPEPYSYGDRFILELRFQRTAGTGTVAAEVLTVYGVNIQS